MLQPGHRSVDTTDRRVEPTPRSIPTAAAASAANDLMPIKPAACSYTTLFAICLAQQWTDLSHLAVGSTH